MSIVAPFETGPWTWQVSIVGTAPRNSWVSSSRGLAAFVPSAQIPSQSPAPGANFALTSILIGGLCDQRTAGGGQPPSRKVWTLAKSYVFPAVPVETLSTKFPCPSWYTFFVLKQPRTSSDEVEHQGVAHHLFTSGGAFAAPLNSSSKM